MKKKELLHRIELLKESRDYWQQVAFEARQSEKQLARWLMSDWVNVNESKVGELDLLLQQHIGRDDD